MNTIYSSTVFKWIPLIIGSNFWLSNTVALAEEADYYFGPRAGIMVTSPGTYEDNAAIGLIFGYQLDNCCWSIETEANTTVTNSEWQGSTLGMFVTFRIGRIATDNFYFFPKAKVGLIQNRFTIDGKKSSTENYLGLGVGLDIGDKDYVIEMEFSGALNESLDSDEVAFFSIGILFPI